MINLYQKYCIFIENEEMEKEVSSYIDDIVTDLNETQALTLDKDDYFEQFESILYEKVKSLDSGTVDVWYSYLSEKINSDVKNAILTNINSGIDVDANVDTKINYIFYCLFIFSAHYIKPKYLGKLSKIDMM